MPREAVHTAAGAVAGVVTDAARHFLPAALLAEDEPAPALRSKPARISAGSEGESDGCVRQAQEAQGVRAQIGRRFRSLAEDCRNLIAARSPFASERMLRRSFTLLSENGRVPAQALLESKLDQGLERRQ